MQVAAKGFAGTCLKSFFFLMSKVKDYAWHRNSGFK